MLLTLLLFSMSMMWTAGTRLGYPDYVSPWTLMTAQSEAKSALEFDHGLGVVPGLVEVLVTPVDGAYQGFLFKATGTGSIDDDGGTYGGVVYIYNEVNVRVIVPKRWNQGSNGYAMFTGEHLYWTGGSQYTSRDANVKVRCWLPSNMPSPCFQLENQNVESGPDSSYPTFIEVNHGAGKLPELVIVRTRLTNGGVMVGYYSDSQGTDSYVAPSNYQISGGVKSAFDEQTVRVWISTDTGGKHLFATFDGWGIQGISTVGVLDIRVWCELGLNVFVNNTVNIGPDVLDEQLNLTLNTPGDFTSSLDVFASIMVKAVDGPNEGYHFHGIDGVRRSSGPVSGLPCVYGGLIYSYNAKSVILRRPSSDHGALVCIADTYASGTNTGAIRNGVISVKMWRLGSEISSSMSSKIYTLHQSDSGLDYPDIGTVRTPSKIACLSECTKRPSCESVKFVTSQSLCTMYDSFHTSYVISEPGSDVWYAM